MKLTMVIFLFLFVLNVSAEMTGVYSGEFDRADWHCQSQIDLNQKLVNTVIFNQWDEYCETQKGDEYSKSVSPGLTIKKIDNNHIEWTDESGSVTVETEIADFEENLFHIKFPFEDEDGHWTLEKKLELKNNELFFLEEYFLEGESVFRNEGVLRK